MSSSLCATVCAQAVRRVGSHRPHLMGHTLWAKCSDGVMRLRDGEKKEYIKHVAIIDCLVRRHSKIMFLSKKNDLLRTTDPT